VSSNRRRHKHLVLTRIGKGHRLHALLDVEPDSRTWDLAVSLYDEDIKPEVGRADFIHYYQGGKWDGIHLFFTEHPELLARYESYWLVDDDIEAKVEQVDALFAYVRAHGFEIAQPALTLDSFYSYRLTLQCPGFCHRHTNFVELMMPVLTGNVLKEVYPLFKGTRSGCGIDWMWYRFANRPHESVAIIDDIPMSHRRPLKHHLRARMRQDGVCAIEERARLIETWQARQVYPVAYAGRLSTGLKISSRSRMSFIMTRGYWSVRGLMSGKRWRLVDFIAFAFRQAFSKP
jgi:hypothetical protein